MIFLIVVLRSRFACQSAATPPTFSKMPPMDSVTSSTLPLKKPPTSGSLILGNPILGILNFKPNPGNFGNDIVGSLTLGNLNLGTVHLAGRLLNILPRLGIAFLSLDLHLASPVLIFAVVLSLLEGFLKLAILRPNVVRALDVALAILERIAEGFLTFRVLTLLRTFDTALLSRDRTFDILNFLEVLRVVLRFLVRVLRLEVLLDLLDPLRAIINHLFLASPSRKQYMQQSQGR